MNFVETVAPISIENLKKYFTDKTTFFVINYKDSTLKGNKLLTYLSNLDIPCDINFEGSTIEDCYSMLSDYMSSTMIVNIPSLEWFTINVLLQVKGLRPLADTQFIESNKDLLQTWVERLDSLTLYNMYTLENSEFKEFVKQYPEDTTTDLSGINFVSILKQQEFFEYFGAVDNKNLKYYTHYFNDYMFKGKSLYSFWANENNPLFLLTYGVAEGLINPEQYNEAKKQTIEELANATPV